MAISNKNFVDKYRSASYYNIWLVIANLNLTQEVSKN